MGLVEGIARWRLFPSNVAMRTRRPCHGCAASLWDESLMKRLAEVLIACGAVCTLAWASAVGPAQTAPSAPPGQAGADSREERLWGEIVALRDRAPTTQPYEEWFASALTNKRALAERIRLYLTLYPGGAHRDDVVRLELATLFDVASLAGGDFAPLRERVDRYLRSPPSDAVLAEAAYWRILCDRLTGSSPASQPASTAASPATAELLAAYRKYLRSYPRSRYVPRLATILFEDAARRGERAEMRDLVDLMSRGFPKHLTTEDLAARLRREDATGKPFWLAFRDADGRNVDTRELAGRPVLIVVWAAYDDAARRCVSEVETLRREHPEFAVVGVNLDATRAAMSAATAELGLDWPQFNDELGRANSFARHWGVRRIPRVFAIDRSGRLVGSASQNEWRRLALAALE